MGSNRGPANANGQSEDQTRICTTSGNAFQRIRQTIIEFAWHNYGLDAVGETVGTDDPSTAEWADELAAEIIAALA